MAGTDLSTVVKGLHEQIVSWRPTFQKLLPRHLQSEDAIDRFERLVQSLVSGDAKLARCTTESIFSAAQECARLGLFPSKALGHVYILPFKNQAVFIPGWKGLNLLAKRSANALIMPHIVHEGDEFDWAYEYGGAANNKPWLRHKESMDPKREEAPITHAWAAIDFPDGRQLFRVLDRYRLDVVKKRSPAYSSKFGPWFHVADEQEMMRKTVIKYTLKLVPISTELDEVLARDDAIDAGVVDVSYKVDDSAPPPAPPKNLDDVLPGPHDEESAGEVDSAPSVLKEGLKEPNPNTNAGTDQPKGGLFNGAPTDEAEKGVSPYRKSFNLHLQALGTKGYKELRDRLNAKGLDPLGTHKWTDDNYRDAALIASELYLETSSTAAK